MNKEDAEKYLQLLGQELQKQGVTGEILVHDDIYVLLDIKIPEIVDANAYLTSEGDALETMDAYFGGNGEILSQTLRSLADSNNVSSALFYSAIDIVFSWQHNKWIEYPGICIYEPPPDYVFTMKVVVSKDQHQEKDILQLAKELKINNAQDALLVMRKYLPSKLITARIRAQVKHYFTSFCKEQEEVVHG